MKFIEGYIQLQTVVRTECRKIKPERDTISYDDLIVCV